MSGPRHDGLDIENLPPPEDDDYDDDLWFEPPLTETPEQRVERLDREARRFAEIRGEIDDLRFTIEDRRQHGATDESLRQDELRLLTLEFALEDAVADAELDEEPILVQPPRPRSSFDPQLSYRSALASALTPVELDHLGAIHRGETQESIAARLGISQGAVSKREDRLRNKVNPIHLGVFGRHDPILERSAIPGRQGRRRAKE